MNINCPEGWSRKAKLGSLTIEYKTITVRDCICVHADQCVIEHCRYYDLSREATRRFQRASAHEYTLEGMLESLTRH